MKRLLAGLKLWFVSAFRPRYCFWCDSWQHRTSDCYLDQWERD